MAEEFTVTVEVNDGIGVIGWNGAVDLETLAKAVSLAADDVLLGHEVRRVEVAIPATDAMARTALHRAGFRREGVRRHGMGVGDGSFVDVLLYARLAGDVVYGPMGFSSVMETVLPTKRLIGHVMLRNAQGQVLLQETTYKDDWELPGGVVEPGEPPRVGAEREVLEELGLHVQLGSPVLVDWMPPSLGWSDALEFIYDAGVLSDEQVASLVPEAREIKALHWVDPAEVVSHVSEISGRRLSLVLGGFTGFSEDGVAIG